MTILYLNLALVFIFSLTARYFAVPVTVTDSMSIVKPSKFWIMLGLLSLVLVSGLRNTIGDTYFYMHAYEIHDFTWDRILNNKDIGFGILQMILQQFSEDAQVMIFVTALITNVLIVLTLYKYARLIEVALYVYVTSGLFLVSMNGIRQFLAASIVFAATKYIFEGKWKRFMLVVLFASTFHQSALILIPIYFLVRREAWTKLTFMLLVVAVLIVLGYNQFTQLLFSAIEDTQYGHYVGFEGEGASVIRIAVSAAPLALAFLGREKLRELSPKSDYIVNLSLLNLLFMIISSQNWIFARFTIYFGLYQLVLIAWIVKLFKEKDQKLIYITILISYFIYFFYEHVISLNISYRSPYL
ncbi:EpsG family protein [Bacillus suaedae]|uniref:EpsG family protein n=1 Tax=Halalkalibacter suaedae TaxID=2822140 RepID=A0A941API3_9BACI|nr:EpsG family protein [Bacillus suaedae]MBP3951522.1 EpsG family protein [Bacillus suaedae]